ncbi:hypothetical protein MASR2M18_15220 [Ignavibacteria bacterium]|jgi:uncharacterized membrane protein YheB (UPF0754 family)|nr:hemerythrin domain-containing protein [Bacteroidota bacterium]MCZ2132626.1 hemerythrin domain-containing protein [Bacteroidota bacterium]
MEKTNPIKRNEAIAELSRDHHFALLLVWKIREGLKKAVKPERIAEYIIYFFNTELLRHLKDEEKYLYDRVMSDNEMKIQAVAEREKIYATLDFIQNNSADENILRNFAESLEKHIRFEERKFFDFFQRNATEVDMSQAAVALKNREHEDEDAWEDTFWK